MIRILSRCVYLVRRKLREIIRRVNVSEMKVSEMSEMSAIVSDWCVVKISYGVFRA